MLKRIPYREILKGEYPPYDILTAAEEIYYQIASYLYKGKYKTYRDTLLKCRRLEEKYYSSEIELTDKDMLDMNILYK